MPRLLRLRAATSCLRVTFRSSTRSGTGRSFSLPSVRIQRRRALCRCAAIARMVRLGIPGTSVAQSFGGICSIRLVSTRLLVRQAVSNVAERSAGADISARTLAQCLIGEGHGGRRVLHFHSQPLIMLVVEVKNPATSVALINQ